MQKTVKTGFRGERKRILTPSLSQGEGECRDGKGGMWGQKGEEIIRELANWEMRKWGGVGYYDDFLVKIN